MSAERMEPRSLDPVRIYLEDIGQHPLLTAEQEVTLAKSIEAGVLALRSAEVIQDGSFLPTKQEFREWVDSEGADVLPPEVIAVVDEAYAARQEFFLSNLRLVVSIAKRYAPVTRHMSLLDLIQEGNIGLTRAIDKYDYRRGFKFSTYATWWIRQAIRRSIDDLDREIRIPANMADTIGEKARAEIALRQQNGDTTPTREEIASRLGLSMLQLKNIEDAEKLINPLSLNAPVGDSEDSELGDLLPADSDPDHEQDRHIHDSHNKDMVARFLESLEDPRERKLIIMRFGLNGNRPQTLEEVGKEFGVTRSRIGQIESKLLYRFYYLARREGWLEELLSDVPEPKIYQERTNQRGRRSPGRKVIL